MSNDTLDTFTRLAGTDRRRALLALGAAGLATTLAGTSRASGKQRSGNKARKKAQKTCKKQKAACIEGVTAICAPSPIPSECEALLFPCCAECDVAVGVICTLNAFD